MHRGRTADVSGSALHRNQVEDLRREGQPFHPDIDDCLGTSSAAAAGSPSWAAAKPVVVLQNAEPVSLDPMFTQSDANVVLSIHEGLFRLDNEGKVVPAIAESIANVDPLNWDIKIRRGPDLP